MPNFHHNLLGIGPLCDHDCRVLFEKTAVTVFSRQNTVLLHGYHEPTGAKLWRFHLDPSNQVSLPAWQTGPAALNAHDLPSVGALVKYLHAAAGFPVKSTWLAAIKAGNYASWPDLTYTNASKYCPHSVETLMGHTKQTRSGVRSTKPPAPTATPRSYADVARPASSPARCLTLIHLTHPPNSPQRNFTSASTTSANFTPTTWAAQNG